MPYLRGGDFDRARFPEEVYWFLNMGPVKTVSTSEPAIMSNEVFLSAREITEGYREDVEDDPSRPPSPPESPASSCVTIAPCPVRLTSLIPPDNYGAVEPFTIYRSSMPWKASIDFLESLRIKSMLSLVMPDREGNDTPVLQFLRTYGIDHQRILIQKNKGELRTTTESLCEALLFIMNPANHPVYIHCNMGKHRTGCVVACLRKCQQWPIDQVLAEYHTYAADKARATDIEVIKAFDPACVYEYAKDHKRLHLWPREPRQDSAADVWDLAASLPAHELSQLSNGAGFEDAEEEHSDFYDAEGLTMKRSQKCVDFPAKHMSNGIDPSRHHGQADESMNGSALEVNEDNEVQMGNSADPAAADGADCGQDTVALYRTTSTTTIAMSSGRGNLRR